MADALQVSSSWAWQDSPKLRILKFDPSTTCVNRTHMNTLSNWLTNDSHTGPHMRNQSKSCKWDERLALLESFSQHTITYSNTSRCPRFRSPGCERCLLWGARTPRTSLKWVENRRSSFEGSKDYLQHVQTIYSAMSVQHSIVIVKYFLSGAQQWQSKTISWGSRAHSPKQRLQESQRRGLGESREAVPPVICRDQPRPQPVLTEQASEMEIALFIFWITPKERRVHVNTLTMTSTYNIGIVLHMNRMCKNDIEPATWIDAHEYCIPVYGPSEC